MKQMIGIPMGIDPTPFLGYRFLYSCEEEFMPSLISSNKVKARHFNCTKRFIEGLCAENDFREFGKSFFFKYIHNSLSQRLSIRVTTLAFTITTSLYINCLIKEMHSRLQ